MGPSFLSIMTAIFTYRITPKDVASQRDQLHTYTVTCLQTPLPTPDDTKYYQCKLCTEVYRQVSHKKRNGSTIPTTSNSLFTLQYRFDSEYAHSTSRLENEQVHTAATSQEGLQATPYLEAVRFYIGIQNSLLCYR